MSKTIPVDYDPFAQAPRLETVAVDYDPFESQEAPRLETVAVDYDPFESEVEPEFGPLREGYKGIDKEAAPVMPEPVAEPAAEPAAEPSPRMYYRGAGMTPAQFKNVAEDLEAFGRDVKKVAYSIPRGVVDIAASGLMESLTGLDMSKLKSKDREELVNTLTNAALEATSPAFSLVDWENTNIINPETARIGTIETIPGMVGQIGALIVGAGKIAKGTEFLYKGMAFLPSVAPKAANWMRQAVVKTEGSGKYIATAIVKRPKTARGLALLTGGEVVTQVMFDPEENMFNAIETAIDKDAEGMSGLAQSMSEYIAADKDDSEILKRLKLSVENVGFSAVFSAVANAPTIGKYLVGKHPSQMSKAEQETALYKALGEEQQVINMQNPETLHLVKETAEGKAQVQKQNKYFLYRMNQKFFKSRGYATPLMFHAANNTKYSQRQLVTEAEDVAERLKIALESAGSDKKLVTKVGVLLETDLTRVLKMPAEKQVSFLAKNRNIPENVAAEILKFRKLQDGLSTRILNMKGFSDDVKASIDKNLGSYIRRTYRAYEDPNYTPTPQIMKEAEDYLVADLQASAIKNGTALTSKDALKQAQSKIKKMLKADEETIDYLAQVNRVSNMKQRKEIDPTIRALLGEITDPSEKIILSIAKLSRISEMQNFYNVVNQLSKGRGGYVATEENIAAGLTVQIKGTNSILDNKYTTREMEKVILNKEETYDTLREGTGAWADSWRTYVGFKGASQASKTVYSHTTQARNIIGGAQFMLANGRGFSESAESFLVLENKVFGLNKKIGDKTGLYKIDDVALKETYNEMQRLGVIGTSVNVNQFREMISTGFKGYDDVYSSIGDSVATKRAKTALRKPQDVYSAADDFHKMTYYHQELKTLKEAHPDAAEELLKRKAAGTVRNTMPNYDAIPKGIKQLRNLPLGNFISFPAEVMRTSFHIVRQASKEINSDNAVIKRRGQMRLAGFATANVGYGAIAKMSHDTFTMSDQEIEDRRVLKAGRFSSGHDLVYSQGEDGEYYTTNTEYLNSYYFVKEPVLAVLDRIESGQLKGEALDEMLLGAIGSGIKALTDPFTDQSMIVAPFVNMAVASLSQSGKDLRGRELFPDKDSTLDTLGTVITEALKPLIPGSALSLIKLKDALEEKPNKYYGRFRDKDYALLEQIGIKKDLYLEDDYLGAAVDDYKLQNDQNRLDSVNLESTGEGRTADYLKTNAVEYQYQQDLYIKLSAYARLYTPERAMTYLINRGMSKEKANTLLQGTFLPLTPPTNPTKYRTDAINLQTGQVQAEFRSQMETAEKNIYYAQQEMKLLSLTNVGDFKFEEEKEAPVFSSGVSGINLPKFDNSFLDDNPPLTPEEREEAGLSPMAVGGVVSTPIPNAPAEPDERIDKLTGLPYNERAGTAYMDISDPLRALNMAAGGRVQKNAGGKVLNALKRNCS